MTLQLTLDKNICLKGLANFASKILLSVGLILLISSCGGGGGTSAGSTSQPTPPPTPNSAPAASNVGVSDSSGGDVQLGDTLVGSYTYTDAETDAEGNSTFSWLRNGVAISGATAINYVLSAIDADSAITFEVTPVAATGTSSGSAVSSASISVEAIAINSGNLPDVERYLLPGSYECTASELGTVFNRPEGLPAYDCALDSGCDEDLVVAHRGADAFAPENTLASARAAILLGMDVVEADVRVTDDDRVIVLHDSSLDRTTNIDSEGYVPGDNDKDPFVFRRTLADIQSYGIVPEPEDPLGDWSCLTVPTMEELLTVTKDKISVLLDINDTSRERAPSVGLAVAAYLDVHPEFDGQVTLACDIESSNDGGGIIPSECDTIRDAYPDVPILIRVLKEGGTGLLNAADMARYSPPLMIQAATSALSPAIKQQVSDASAKLYYSSEALSLDDQVVATGNPLLFLQSYSLGADVLLSNNYSHLVLHALERLTLKGAFFYVSANAVQGQIIQFTDNSSPIEGLAVLSWHWDFGDTNTSDEQHPSHTYTSAGEYIVVLNITDSAGNTDSFARTLTVN